LILLLLCTYTAQFSFLFTLFFTFNGLNIILLSNTNNIEPITLSALAGKIGVVIKNTFNSDYYWVVAEISGHKFYSKEDRHYFDFIEKPDKNADPIAKLKGIAWKVGSQHITAFENGTGQKFTNGIQVLAKVKVEFHNSFGLSLVLIDIDLAYTLGNIEKQRRETIKKLLVENPDSIVQVGEEFVTNNKKVNLKLAIQNIAIIGSPNSEGFVDFTHTLLNNQYNYQFSYDVFHTSVQGAEAENEIVNSLITIFNTKKVYDAVVIIRGGGAKSDFLVFDSYKISRAVARFPIPIITGIGHHKDISIVDLMVNTSTKTPTKAAEFIISHNKSFEDNLLDLQKAILFKTQQTLSKNIQQINFANMTIINKSKTYISDYKDSINNYNQVVINKTKTIIYKSQNGLMSMTNQLLTKPKIITAAKQSELNNIVENMKKFSTKYFFNKKGYIAHYESVIRVMNFDSILKRGFAVISFEGKIIKDAEKIEPGAILTIQMDKNNIDAKVITKTKTNE